MSSDTSTHARQYHGESADHGYPESRFSRFPWEKIEHREPGRSPVTLWLGASRVIVAVEMPGIDLGDVAVSVLESRLMFRRAEQLDFSLDIPLPCAVEVNPVILTKGKGILCILLTKKQEADPAKAA